MTVFLLNHNKAISPSLDDKFYYLFFSKPHRIKGSDKIFTSRISASGKYELIHTLFSQLPVCGLLMSWQVSHLLCMSKHCRQPSSV